MPKRIQRKRTKGWRMPPDTVYVGRGSKWGNPFQVHRIGNHDLWMVVGECGGDLIWIGPFVEHRRALNESLKFFDDEACGVAFEREVIKKLKGKNLACWCPLDQMCHADVLLEMANE